MGSGDKLKEEIMKEVCEICLHPITNPVCVTYYLKHARLWLEDFKLTEKNIKLALNEIKSKIPQETSNSYECILCGKEDVSVCMFCSFLRTSKVLLKMETLAKTKESYIRSYNLQREDYD